MASFKQTSHKPIGDKPPMKQLAKKARKHVTTTCGVKKPYSNRRGNIVLR
ncbi:unnamed protein product [Lupinus luteus]|uniref:Uncharacterized protein n=1 Tax=Lupinus luteus TaxID=3873 RepID=A0AAV1Y9Q8_LUPLU